MGEINAAGGHGFGIGWKYDVSLASLAGVVLVFFAGVGFFCFFWGLNEAWARLMRSDLVFSASDSGSGAGLGLSLIHI